jgi:hypothetical protein
MKQIFILLFFAFLITGCKKDEPTIETINTDISVASNESIIFWVNQNDLNQKINDAIVYNLGNVPENEVVKTLTFNSDNSKVTATINFKEEFQQKYYDPNLSNNSIEINIFNDQIISTDIGVSNLNSEEVCEMMGVLENELPNFNINNFNPVCIPITFQIPPGITISENSLDEVVANLNSNFFNSKISFIRNNTNTTDNDYYNLAVDDIDNFTYDEINNLNIYISHTLTNNGDNLKGLAHLPTEFIDRVYVREDLMNISNDPESAVLTHEIGHFFSLLHTFQNNIPSWCITDNDHIGTTPFEELISGESATEHYGTNCNPSDPNLELLIRNFMSYSLNSPQLINCDRFFDILQRNRIAFSAMRWKSHLNCQSTSNSTIQLTPNSLSFPNTQINTTSSQLSFTVSNTGNSSFSITGFNVPTGFTLVNGQSTVINPNSSITFYVTFHPNNVQSYSGTLEVLNDADNANSSTSTVYLSGNGVDNNTTSTISLSGNLNFGSVEIGQTNTKTFTISNTGNQSFYVSSIDFPYNVYSANWNSGTINANSSQAVTVTFQPNNQQSYNGTVQVISDANSGNNTISISGTGVNVGQPNLVYSNYRIVNDDNNNGIVEAGEDIDFDIEVFNNGNATAHNVEVYFDTNDSDINITDHSQGYGSVSQNSYDWNSGNLDFIVSNDCPTKTVNFTAHFTSDEGSWDDTFSIDVQGQSSSNPIPITPTDGCNDAPTLEINTEYIVNLDLSNGSIGYAPPIEGESYNGANVQGFWLKFNEPSGFVGDIDIKIYDVSNNFDPVIGHKLSCGGTYYTQWNLSTFVANDGSYGVSETFADHSENNGYTHRIRIYHYYGNETPNISFKIKIEEQ